MPGTAFDPVDIVGLPTVEKRSLQGERLAALVARLAASGNPFWTERLADVDPTSITSVDDLTSLPFTVKQDLRDQYPLGMVTTPMAKRPASTPVRGRAESRPSSSTPPTTWRSGPR